MRHGGTGGKIILNILVRLGAMDHNKGIIKNLIKAFFQNIWVYLMISLRINLFLVRPRVAKTRNHPGLGLAYFGRKKTGKIKSNEINTQFLHFFTKDI